MALRAELDARPLPSGDNEPDSHSPHSEIPGLMHNCGHDVHASILLGTAAELIHHRNWFNGRVVFLFQPAEETAGGADDVAGRETPREARRHENLRRALRARRAGGHNYHLCWAHHGGKQLLYPGIERPRLAAARAI